MKNYAPKKDKQQTLIQSPTIQPKAEKQQVTLNDNRSETVMQQRLVNTVNNSDRVTQLQQYQEMADNSQTAKANQTGLPLQLKSGIENLSGYAMDDVKVHYNSDKPAQLKAHAYAQGTDIHLASGQEKHLPHEAWHVVQQKQGRVKPTLQMKGKVNVNDDKGLEHEADVMGAKALKTENSEVVQQVNNNINANVVQRNQESANTLLALTEPRVGQQNIEFVKGIQDDIEAIYLNTIEENNGFGLYNGATCLGGIELNTFEGFNNFNDLVEQSTLINIGKGSVGTGIYSTLDDELKQKIVRNTLETMAQAGQLTYLENSDFANGDEWKIVIEIHYYRTRIPNDTGNVFHKDSFGNTLFVNLNYLNNEPIAGPEYLINPKQNNEHINNIAQSLPPEFIGDKQHVLAQLNNPEIIETVEIPEYGYVTFVDELINHSSPTPKHREVEGSVLRSYLITTFGEEYNAHQSALEKYNKQRLKVKKYNKYLDDETRTERTTQWKNIIKNLDDNILYNKAQIRELISNDFIDDEGIEVLLHDANYNNFGKVSIPNPNGASIIDHQTEDNRSLIRRMSMHLEDQNPVFEKTETGGKRSFFRTWVRAERIDKVVEQPNWNWRGYVENI